MDGWIDGNVWVDVTGIRIHTHTEFNELVTPGVSQPHTYICRSRRHMFGINLK